MYAPFFSKVIREPLPFLSGSTRFAKFYDVPAIPKDIKPTNISLLYKHTHLPAPYMMNKKQAETKFLWFPSILTLKQKCIAVPGSTSIFFIKVARNAVDERYRIRRYFRSHSNLPVKNYFFIMGTSSDGKAFSDSPNLVHEMETYNDIVIADFVDTYNNLPLKTKVNLICSVA